MDVQFARLEQRVSALEDDAKEFHQLLEPLKERSIRLDEHYIEIMKTLNEVKDDVKELKDRPSKFLDYLLMTIIACIISFLFKMFGN